MSSIEHDPQLTTSLSSNAHSLERRSLVADLLRHLSGPDEDREWLAWAQLAALILAECDDPLNDTAVRKTIVASAHRNRRMRRLRPLPRPRQGAR